ncbi:citramalate synthase [Chthonomonas calidirosea]|uniref:citramalate synthase n=1 Tax=Chthonomonas calidirosea TaxID=454171 RepID=UPI0009E8E743|nr:citramalate synthase [Chthonomonas calidirosea]
MEALNQQKRRIEIYDTTLRDGSQGEGISFSVEDKVRIARRLDEFGVDFIEGGWPGSNPKDVAFFEQMREVKLRHALLTAFGSTRRAGVRPEEDPQIRSLIDSGASAITIVGKSWDAHVIHALRVSLEENLAMIAESVAYLKQHVPMVLYDAEHFFDGYRANPAYALRCLQVAFEAGADRIVLCDTNGGSLPQSIAAIVREVRQALPEAQLGIHTHNDSACAVAGALAAIEEGAMQVQGTINGYGERCGNCDLVPVVAALRFKMGYECLLPDSLRHLTALSQYVDEIANIAPDTRRPYVGRSAFAHKGGLHADAVLKGASYEHIHPEAVGNTRRLLVSELAGSSSIAGKAAEFGIRLDKKSPEARHLMQVVAEHEHAGYSYEGAEASFELLLLRTLGLYKPPFTLKGFRCITEKRGTDKQPITEATVKVEVNGQERLTVAEGDGPVHALDGALRQALLEFYPALERIKLTDFKVRVINGRAGTAAKVRVMIDSTDGEQTWSTVGVSENVIEASWLALVDSVVYGLIRSERLYEALSRPPVLTEKTSSVPTPSPSVSESAAS